jgi:hypothetical protein
MSSRIVIRCDVCKQDSNRALVNTLELLVRMAPESKYRDYDICATCAPRFWAFIMNGKEGLPNEPESNL